MAKMLKNGKKKSSKRDADEIDELDELDEELEGLEDEDDGDDDEDEKPKKKGGKKVKEKKGKALDKKSKKDKKKGKRSEKSATQARKVATLTPEGKEIFAQILDLDRAAEKREKLIQKLLKSLDGAKSFIHPKEKTPMTIMTRDGGDGRSFIRVKPGYQGE